MAHVQIFAKVDAHLDTHPKIEEAGFWASTVFQALLRINRANGFDGVIPPRYCSPRYIARRLKLKEAAGLNMSAEDLVFSAIAECCIKEVNLLEVTDEGGLSIVGWDDEWRGAVSDAERARKYRESKKSPTPEHHDASQTVTDRHEASRDITPVTHIEKRREEKNREEREKEESPNRRPSHQPPAEALELSQVLVGAISARLPESRPARSPDQCAQQWAAHIDKLHRLDKRPWSKIREVLDWSQRDRFWQQNILSGKKLREKFDQLEAQMGQPGRASSSQSTQRGLSVEDLWRMSEENPDDQVRDGEVPSDSQG